ncbi:MAG: erythromycin esterase family protein [Chitinophagaceae bacterium]|nr:erythromycin esterase family protein [Chitinophagaceae bacterium]
MKPLIISLILIFFLQPDINGQITELQPGSRIEKNLLKGEKHIYGIHLKKGEYAEFSVNQKSVLITLDLLDQTGKKIKTFNLKFNPGGPETVSIIATKTGDYRLQVYPVTDIPGLPDSLKQRLADENQGVYSIDSFTKLSPAEYRHKLAQGSEDENTFQNWMTDNSHPIKTVDAGNGFEDLQPFKNILKGVRVVGLGESTHGTSEFFRMKHRMLEFLVTEMGFTSFYIEASMARCRYINDYVLYNKGNLDTATAIHGFIVWRVEEVRNLIKWIHDYNAGVPDEKKVKFFGFDLQVNDSGWKSLKTFYDKVNPGMVSHLDSLKIRMDTAAKWINSTTLQPERTAQGIKLFKELYPQCISVMNDLILNKGLYQFLTSKERYEENLMNIRLIVQETESYKDENFSRRDYFMAQNILELLGNQGPDEKVVVWAHNGHISKSPGKMGAHLSKTLGQEYYAVGFEFYSGSFQSRDLLAMNRSKHYDIITIDSPPVKSLPWYLNATGKDKLFIDFRNTGTDKIHNFSKMYNMHSFGSVYSKFWPETYPESLTDYDGLIFIKLSTAAKDFTKVVL